jgi:hypothetical protein
MSSDDQFYEQALQELRSHQVVDAAFARAYADAAGDNHKTRAFYIRMRVENLAQGAAAKKEAHRIKIAEEARIVREAEETRIQKELAAQIAREMQAELDAAAPKLEIRLGRLIHVVDRERRINTSMPMKKMLLELPSFSHDTVYFDREADAFLNIVEFNRKVDEEAQKNR